MADSSRKLGVFPAFHKVAGRKVIVVGGRQFTSATMQQNCHEFIAYENLVGTRSGGRSAGRGAR